ncbi:MAG: response regulator [bacterium]|nr:MAG: response regulator [bacterium]
MEKRRILLVEETELLLQVERSVLTRDSFELFTARSGREALEKALKLTPHLIILSNLMPDVSGAEVCSVIKADPQFRNTKVVIATSDHGEDTLSSCIDAGCDGIVTKPFDREKFLDTVQKLLGETFRRKPRYAVRIPCAVYLQQQGLPAEMLDISEIGCRLEMDEPPARGAEVKVAFTLPDTVQSVHWTGVVRWRKDQANDSGLLEAGIEFLATPEAELMILRDILDSLPASARL